MFFPHPCPELNALFSRRPFQGAAPEQAEFLFVGLDANYAPDIATTSIFPKILEYHDDGVAFWRRYGVHHPFLLDGYTGDGRRYHRNFSRIGFTSEQANLVSFVELLAVPTVGRSMLTASDLSPSHLKWLGSLILEGPAHHVFIPDKVAKLMRSSGRFPWLPRDRIKIPDSLDQWLTREGKTIYFHLHFSVYGTFEQRRVLEADSIRALVPTVGRRPDV